MGLRGGRGAVAGRCRLLAAAVSAGVLVVLACTGPAAPAGAIANGVPVPAGRYRFAVKLTMTGVPRPDGTQYDSACSGALIAPRWVITAGHCLHDVNRTPVSGPVPYPTTATLGVTDLADPARVVVDVVTVFQSPSNDIALLELARSVRGVRPLDLGQQEPASGQVLRITGWGALGDVDPTPATHLQTGEVTVDSVAATTIGVIGHAPAADTSACLYDSGAPYFTERRGRPRLVSVESNGPACPHASPETTSRVDVVLPWIRNTLRPALRREPGDG